MMPLNHLCAVLSSVLIAAHGASAQAPIPLDPSSALAEDGLLWYDAQCFGEVEGRGWSDTEKPFDRLPARAKTQVREAVWTLSRYSAGLTLRFFTDAEEISARWVLQSKSAPLEYMSATGASGLDLYVRDGEKWRWAGLARPAAEGESKVRILINIPHQYHEYLVYLPLFNGVESVRIGVKPGAHMAKAPDRSIPAEKPVVFYGTSITHGVSASRPGMSYPSILSRHLGRPAINLGFAGNGTMDLELADLMGEIDAAAYVIDCLPNMSAAMVKERTVLFVDRLHARRPGVPILLVGQFEQENAWLIPRIADNISENNRALRDGYEVLRASGMRRVTYVPMDGALGREHDATVDGIHPSDLGFTRLADALEPVLRRLLQ